jgi:hypothetical protein
MAAKEPTIWQLNNRRLTRNSWWFKLGIPATVNFPEYFALEAKEDKTPQEIELRKSISNKIIEIIHLYHNHQTLPAEILPHTMYADFQIMYAAVPREYLARMPPLFAISDGYIVITEPLLAVLRKFRLGSTQIVPVKLRDKTTNELLSEQTYYFINVCERHSYCSLEFSDPSLRKLPIKDRVLYHSPSDKATANKFIFSKQALDCPVDIWHDPLIYGSIFFSHALSMAIYKAKLNKGFYLFACNLA